MKGFERFLPAIWQSTLFLWRQQAISRLAGDQVWRPFRPRTLDFRTGCFCPRHKRGKSKRKSELTIHPQKCIYTSVTKELAILAVENCGSFNLRWVTGAVTQFYDAEMRRQMEKLTPAWHSAQSALVKPLGEKCWSAILSDLETAALALNQN
jgi:hypothetical protein